MMLFNPVDAVWRLWQTMNMTHWQWTIDEALHQPESWLNDVLAIDAVAGRVREQIIGKAR